MPTPRLSILGLGLLGGSIGLAVRRGVTEWKITGYDTDLAAVRSALDLNAIDAGTDSVGQAVASAELVILAAPVSKLPSLLTAVIPHLSKEAVITDVGSTKRSIVDLGERLIPGRFVGSHPMAGGDRSGIEAARADLFDDATVILTVSSRAFDRIENSPVSTQLSAALSTVATFWKSLGLRVQQMSPDDHDRLIASASHLPHAVAAMLLASLSPESIAVSGKGLADTTRIAAGDASLWEGILLDNADYLRSALTNFRAELDRFEQLLDPQHSEALRAYLAASAARRRRMT